MKIKVCGITRPEQMQELKELGADYAGMIFFKGSRRYVGQEMKNGELRVDNAKLSRVGVFVNADLVSVEKAIADYHLKAVQLHGDESPEFCLALKGKADIIKAFRVRGNEDIDALIAPYQGACEYFLFDTETKEFGGSGKQFDWKILEKAEINKPFFLSGGIGLEDADKLNQFHHPFFHAVDVNSRFETEPGVKDIQMVAKFINTIHNG
jgi:phosphoribosylanthranilate isomerase